MGIENGRYRLKAGERNSPEQRSPTMFDATNNPTVFTRAEPDDEYIPQHEPPDSSLIDEEEEDEEIGEEEEDDE